MQNFILKPNKFLEKETPVFYHYDYIGYQKEGNPDFINKLKNMTNQHNELDLVEDFIQVSEVLLTDITEIIDKMKLHYPIVCVVPRSKRESSYQRSQLLFKKSVSSIANKLKLQNGTDAIIRKKDTKTTHNWRLENNTGDAPYLGITKDTCKFNINYIKGKDIILVDDIFTEQVYVDDDCIQTLLNLGAKSVILYAVAKTRG